MALDPTLQAWFDEAKKDGSISAEDVTAIEAVAERSPSMAQRMKDSYLRQSDYSRKQSELQAENAKVSAFQAELGQWKTGADEKLKAALVAQAAAETKLRVFAAANGIDPNEAVHEAQVAAPTFDATKYLTVEQAQEQMRQGITESALVDATISDLQEQHKSLFGGPIPSAAQLVQEAIAAKKSLSNYWEEKYSVPAKRQELNKAAIETQIRQGIEAGMAKERSEMALNPQATFSRNTNHQIFNNPNLTKPVAADHVAGGGVAAAVAAWQSGKHGSSRH